MKKPTFGERLRYAFDNTLSRGTIALIGWLAVVSLALILAIALIVRLTRLAPDVGFAQLVWMALMRTLDAGTMGGDQGSWPYLFAMLGVTLGGIFVISTLISILTTGLESRIENLRKGRSRVIESGHTVILGWSDQVYPIISELAIANASQRRSCIVILGDKDKIEMEDEIRTRLGSTGRTRVVCRSGSPMDMADLQIASLPTAKSIIIVPPTGDYPDAQVIKTLAAITNSAEPRPERYHIVAAVRDPRAVPVAHMVAGDQVEIVLTTDLIARIMAQTCRQSGLSTVYTELLDFSGNEFYFHEEPGLVGKTFGEAMFAYEDSLVLGICPAGGAAQLNPAMETRIAAGDRLIVIAEDDSTIHLSGAANPRIQEDAIQPDRLKQQAPERTLILGWNKRAPAILAELDGYVTPGSSITVVADYPQDELALGDRIQSLKNQTYEYLEGDTIDRRVLDSLHIETYDHVFILCYSDTMDMQQADARTFLTLLHLRDIADRLGHPFSITSEMLDVRNRDLADVAQADDFIVSDKLVSLLLAQVSENKAVNAVFADLFDPEGVEIYLKPAADYVALGVGMNFYTVIEAARRHGEVALGYRLEAWSDDKARAYGVVLSPKKSEIITFAQEDRVVVLAES